MPHMKWPFQFDLKMPFMLSAGMLAGGQTLLGMVSHPGYYDGRPVALSVRGQVIYFTMGCIAGLATAFAFVKGPSLLRIEPPWPWRGGLLNALVLLFATMALSSLFAGGFCGMLVFFFGHAFFFVLHDVP